MPRGIPCGSNHSVSSECDVIPEAPGWRRTEKRIGRDGQGSGRVTGERIHDTMTWTNNPRRREDGVWCPDLTGVIRTEEGEELLVSIKGYSILEQMPTVGRAIVAAVWLQAQDQRL